MGESTTKERGVVNFRLSAAGALEIQSERLMYGIRDGARQKLLEEGDFCNYGRIVGKNVVPYRLEGENFNVFVQRESGLNRSARVVIQQAVENLFITSGIPIADNDRERLKILDQLFTEEEVNQLQSYAILVPSEEWHNIALAFEKNGYIEPGKVTRVDSPLPSLRNQAFDDINSFFHEVANLADGVYGAPNYFPKPSTEHKVVSAFKAKEIMPQEAGMIGVFDFPHRVWGFVVEGEVINDSIPMRSIEGSEIKLIVLDKKNNQLLTSKFIEKKAFLKYVLAKEIIKEQRKKMEDLNYLFNQVKERKRSDSEGKIWHYSEPVRL